MVTTDVFVGLSLIVGVAIVVSLIMRALRQPLIIGYILTGILVGPYIFDIVSSVGSVATFAQMGVAVLLFMVGLNLNPTVAREVGKVALITGIGQIMFTFFFGFIIGMILGFDWIVSAYIAIAISFSSTIIIMKLLSDKGDLKTLYGRISIGFLIVQDLVAIVLLMILSSTHGAPDIATFAFQKVAVGIGLLAALIVVSIFLIKPAMKKIAQSQELLLLFSIGWALLIGSLFAYAGFSIEIGALLGGISLSLSPYRQEIGAKMKPLRDFFLLLFFILLGSQLRFEHFASIIAPVVILSLVVLVGNPIIVMSLMGFMGYTKRNSFFAGLTVSQISEFSFILIALGVSLGHLNAEMLSLMTLVRLITMGGSSYLILGNDKIYEKISRYLSFFEIKGKKIDEGKYYRHDEYDLVLFGYNRIGYSVEKAFRKLKRSFLVVDNDPETILKLARSRIECQYGDAEDSELLDELPLDRAKMIVSTIPDKDTNLTLIKKVLQRNKDAIILVVSHQIEEALDLYEAGATYVITPHFLGGSYTAHLIEKHGLNKKDFKEEGAKSANELLHRQRDGQKDVLHERD